MLLLFSGRHIRIYVSVADSSNDRYMSGAFDAIYANGNSRSVCAVDSFVPFVPFASFPSNPIILRLSDVPQIFPTPVSRNNPLRAIYDCDVPSHPKDHLDHRRHPDASVETELPFSVIEYFERYGQYLDARRFTKMVRVGHALTF